LKGAEAADHPADEIVPPPALIRAYLDALPAIVRARGETSRP
jgi:hypothetical protein